MNNSSNRLFSLLNDKRSQKSKVKSSRQRTRARYRPRLEALESRKLLAAAILEGTTLTLGLTNQDDSVEISTPSANQIQVTVGGGDTIDLGANAQGNSALQLSADGMTLLVTLNSGSSPITNVQVDAGSGSDTLDLNVTQASAAAVVTLLGGDGDDIISAAGLTVPTRILGGAGNDIITGGDANDFIDGGDGDDIIHGGLGDDEIIGGRGDDEIYGGEGNDRLLGGLGSDRIDGGTGNDFVIGDGQIEVTVTNLQGEDGLLLTPVFLATQDGVYDFVNVGSPASESVERLAEDGITSERITAAINSGGVREAIATAGGPLAPGEVRTVTLYADPADPLTRYLSYATMIIPSNDAFVANDDPQQIDLFDGNELIVRRGDNAFVVTGNDVYDAGTEVNDEIPANTAALAQAQPDTGITENGVVRRHEGLQGSARLGGPIGNVLAARPNGDFTAPGSNILSIEIDDFREQTGFSIAVDSAPLTSLTTGQTSAELVAEAVAGNLYFNVHTVNVASGEIRGQLTTQSDTTDGGVRTIVLTATLDSSQEPNGTSTSDATGEATVTIVDDGTSVTYSSDLSIEGITTDELLPVAGVSSIHIHNAPAGVNGPVITDIVQDAGGDINGNAAGTDDGNVFAEVFAAQDDILIGGDGDDVLVGGFGNDELIGGRGNDRLIGGEGDDILAGGGGQDSIDGGSGVNTVSFQGIGVGVTARLNDDGTGVASYGNITETFVGITNLIGSEQADRLNGNSFANTIDGAGGDDLIIGDSGDDILFGGDGNDTVVGGLGNDTITGGAGEDNLIGNGQIEITVTNLQPEQGGLLTPVFLATADGDYDFFNLGGTASTSLERLAEDGTTAPRIAAAINSGGVGDALATPGGPLAPGASRTVTLFADPNNPLTQFLSFASMVIPSNDAFIGNDNPQLIDLFDADGNLITRVGADGFIVTGENVYDAGTEVNDEVPENTAALAQAAPNTGVTENGVIRRHEGFQGSERLGGPIGNILTARSAADFTAAASSQILSIEVQAAVGEDDDIIAGGDGNDTIYGNGGDDQLIGGSGDDTIFGEDGNDSLVGGFGADFLDGGDGDDAVIGDGQIEVTVTNLQPSQGSLLTPVFLATQNGVYDFFNIGGTASQSLERLAEDGITSDRITAALNSGGVNEAVATPGGPLAPGQSRTITLFADPANPLTQYLSYASMVIPSNDAFIGNDDPLQIDLFTGGNLNRAVGENAIVITGDQVLDAGTEVNDEIPGNTAALAQAAPNTGVTENGVIRRHEGFQGSVGFGGPIGNVLSAIPAGDFTAAGSQILSIEIDDAREETGFSLSTPASPLESLTTAQSTDALIAEALASNLYYNVHTVNVGSGEIRGQLNFVSDLVINDIRTIVLQASLDSSQEPAGTSDSDATGTGTLIIRVNGTSVTYTSELTIDGITVDELLPVAGVSAIHVHNAPAGSNGPVILDIVQDAGGDTAGNTADGDVFVETVSSSDDTLIGGLGNDLLSGGAGDDVIIAGPGGDTLAGGTGNDLLAGGGGSDTINGGEGLDINSFEGIGLGVTAELNDDGSGTAQYGPVSETFTGIENFLGSDNDDVLRGNNSPNLINGGGGNDIIDGLGGDDVLVGGEGNDRISSGFGDDLVEGGNGDDSLFGGAGADEVLGQDGNDTIVGGGGADLLSGGLGLDDVTALANVVGLDVTPVGLIGTPVTIPANTVQPQGIPFVAAVDTTITVFSDVAVTSGGYRIVNGRFEEVSQSLGQTQVATLVAGESYVILLDPTTLDRMVTIESSAGANSLNFGVANLANPRSAGDVTGEGELTALDALRIINVLNENNSDVSVTAQSGDAVFTDVNADGNITALDALLVINQLNESPDTVAGQGEPTSSAVIAPSVSNQIDDGESVVDQDSELKIEDLGGEAAVPSFASASSNEPSFAMIGVEEDDSEEDRFDAVFALIGRSGDTLTADFS